MNTHTPNTFRVERFAVDYLMQDASDELRAWLGEHDTHPLVIQLLDHITSNAAAWWQCELDQAGPEGKWVAVAVTERCGFNSAERNAIELIGNDSPNGAEWDLHADVLLEMIEELATKDAA